jgi:hypothetical protein
MCTLCDLRKASGRSVSNRSAVPPSALSSLRSICDRCTTAFPTGSEPMFSSGGRRFCWSAWLKTRLDHDLPFFMAAHMATARTKSTAIITPRLIQDPPFRPSIVVRYCISDLAAKAIHRQIRAGKRSQARPLSTAKGVSNKSAARKEDPVMSHNAGV